MFSDVIIGSGNRGNCAHSIYREDGVRYPVSENSGSYWASDIYLGMGITVFKNTHEGEYIASLIQFKKEPQELVDYLSNLLVSHVKPSVLMGYVDRSLKEAFLNGQRDTQNQIREILGL